MFPLTRLRIVFGGNIVRILVASAIALVAAGCSADGDPPPVAEAPPVIGTPSPSPTPTPTPTPRETATGYDLAGRVLLVEGDDLAVGPTSFVARYASANPSLKVHNLASAGATIATLQSRREEALKLKPDVLTISLALHDLCLAKDAREWARAIDDYAAPFREAGTTVLITSPLPRDSADDNECDKKHGYQFKGATERAFNTTSFGFDAVAHFGGDAVLNAAGATADSNLYVDGVVPTAAAQERLAPIFARTINNVWSVLLGEPALVAPKDDGVTVVVAEGSSSAVTYDPYFNGRYRSKGGFDEWHAAAKGGSGVHGLTKRIDRVKLKNADVVSIYIGVNDLSSFDTTTEFSEKLKSYASQLRSRGTKVLAFTLPNRLVKGQIDERHNEMRKELSAILKKADWIDGYADFAGHPVMGADSAPLDTNLFRDGVHATNYGHSLYFEAYEPAMDRVLSASHPSRE